MKLPLIISLTGLLFSNVILGQFGFTEITNHNLPGAVTADITAFDYDNDNDSDLIISGFLKNSTIITQLYDNDGYGNFILNSNVYLHPVKNSKILTSYFNQDQHKDIVIFGQNSQAESSAYIYINDGQGNFKAKKIQGLDNLYIYTSLHGDIDNDEDIDLIISGRDTNNDRQIFFLLNDQDGNFTIVTNSIINNQFLLNTKIADLDNDSDLDIISFDFEYYNDSGFIFLNDGNGNFLKKTNSELPNYLNEFQIGDVDNDGNSDLIVQERRFNRTETIIYLNDGQANFTEEKMLFVPYKNYDLLLSDLDNNNYLDVLFIDKTSPYTSKNEITLLENLGNGKFSDIPLVLLEGVDGDIEIFDFDNDNDNDIVMTGVTRQKFKTKVFINDLLTSSKRIDITEYVKIFPNPNSGSFQIESNIKSPLFLTINNISGEIIYQTHFNFLNNLNLNLNITPGIYILHLGMNKSTYTYKLVIQ